MEQEAIKPLATMAGITAKKRAVKTAEEKELDKQFKSSAEGFFNNEKALEDFRPLAQPLDISIIDFHYLLTPKLKLSTWQADELRRFAGEFGNQKFTYNKEVPYLMNLRAANGSGKDEIIIGRSALWKTLTGFKNRTIITTGSERQLILQTIPHLTALANRCNEVFGGTTFRSTQKHYFSPRTGSEILAFVTDEPKRAEGYHPWSRDDGTPGEMVIIVNEAKTPADEIFDALDRCTGYTHMLRISSPDKKAGRFYRDSLASVNYPEQTPPAPFIPGRWYAKKVTAWQCDYIPRSHILRQIEAHKDHPEWILSSIDGEFADVDLEHVVIPSTLWDSRLINKPAQSGHDIGIGADWAAGNDECVVYVRKGNKVILEYCFYETDIEKAVNLVDKKLIAFKSLPYIFNADDGGIGNAHNTLLFNRGWRVTRRHNQSPPVHNPQKYLNFGAESYAHIKDLLTYNLLIPYGTTENCKLKDQITHRRARTGGKGKIQLFAKPDERKALGYSPDRADAFVLCFWSYRPKTRFGPAKEPARRESLAELEERIAWGGDVLFRKEKKYAGKPTFICSDV